MGAEAIRRASILTALRRGRGAAHELLDFDPPSRRSGDLRRQFVDSVVGAAGTCVEVADAALLEDRLEELPAYATARRIASTLDGAGLRANVDLGATSDPHELADLDFALVAAELGVAENGAVWVTGQDLSQRAVFFIAEHLAVVLSTSALVDDMHRAYERISFAEPGYGTFIAGPSKTADIEQALVIGAHGARSLTVFLVGS